MGGLLALAQFFFDDLANRLLDGKLGNLGSELELERFDEVFRFLQSPTGQGADRFDVGDLHRWVGGLHVGSDIDEDLGSGKERHQDLALLS